MNWGRVRQLLGSLVIGGAAFGAIAVSLTGLFERDQLPDGHDVWPHVVSTFEVAQAIDAGVPWPRWMPDLCGGYGAPNPLFYAPLAYQLSGRLAGLGLGAVDGLRAAASLAFALGFAGMYVWARRSFGRAGALLAAVLYLFAPYHLVDLYLRFSYPELLGLGLAPWLFWLAQRAVEDGRGQGWVAGALALLALVHNLSALMFGGFLLGYVGCLALVPHNRPGARDVLLGVPLAAGLSAFFWMPALLDVHMVRLSTDATVQTAWQRHLLAPARLLQDHWPGDRDHLPLYPGRVHLALAALGLIAACAQARRRVPGAAAWAAFGALSLATLGLMLEAAAPLWRVLPIKVLQFPWRFLGPAGMGLAWIAPLALTPLRSRRGVHTCACAVLCVAVVFASFRLCRPDRWRLMECNTRMLRTSWQTANLDAQFVPATAVIVPRFDAPVLEVTEGPGVVEVLERGPEHVRARVRASGAVRLAVRQMYFEGWVAELDGSPAALALDEATGGMWLAVPPGDHRLDVAFGWSDLRLHAALISVVTLVLMLIPAEGGKTGRALRFTLAPVAWLVLVGASIAVVWPVARRALPFGPDRHAHRARVLLARRDHEAAVAELALVDPAGPHGAWAAEQLAWHRDHGLTARWFADTAFGLERPRTVLYSALHQRDVTPASELERGAHSAALSARLDIPADGSYAFRVESDLRITLYLDERVVVRELKQSGGRTAEGEVQLARGPHDLVFTLRPGLGDVRYRLWWRAPGSGWRLFPVDRCKPAVPAWLDPLLKRLRSQV